MEREIVSVVPQHPGVFVNDELTARGDYNEVDYDHSFEEAWKEFSQRVLQKHKAYAESRDTWRT